MAGSEGARVSLRCSPFLLLLLGVLAGGCAGPATRVVLLPQAEYERLQHDWQLPHVEAVP